MSDCARRGCLCPPKEADHYARYCASCVVEFSFDEASSLPLEDAKRQDIVVEHHLDEEDADVCFAMTDDGFQCPNPPSRLYRVWPR